MLRAPTTPELQQITPPTRRKIIRDCKIVYRAGRKIDRVRPDLFGTFDIPRLAS